MPTFHVSMGSSGEISLYDKIFFIVEEHQCTHFSFQLEFICPQEVQNDG